MTTIKEYVSARSDAHSSEIQERILAHRQRALRHKAEADRLVRMGDTRQAQTHANIASTHIRNALALEAAMTLPVRDLPRPTQS